MANKEHLRKMNEGRDAWNNWRRDILDKNGRILNELFEKDITAECLYDELLNDLTQSRPDLSRTDLRGAHLAGFKLSGANLSGTNLSGANLFQADLCLAQLQGADLSDSYMVETRLRGANLTYAKLVSADLRGADLHGAIFVQTDLQNANLSDCKVFGLSAWDVNLENAIQSNLVISEIYEPTITVDNLEVAQFVYMLINNKKIREVINTVSEKAVLILGRFTPDRQLILETIREELRKRDYLPILFDFDKPLTRDFTETIIILAGLSKFIIADISAPKSSPLESQAIVPDFMIPYVPIIRAGEKPFAMFGDLLHKHPWVLSPISYKNKADLITNFEKGILQRAERLYLEIRAKKAQGMHAPIPVSEI